MKRLLVTTDFSELGDSAIPPAAELAGKLGAELTICHVLGGERPPKPDKDAPYFKVAQRLFEADEEMERQALASIEERASDLADVEWVAKLARGAAIDGIMAVAKDTGADMIVISSQGRTGLTRILLGSVAEELARESPVPVLIWKQKPE
jgi:nucleotide-binding universal stress UspA family protein